MLRLLQTPPAASSLLPQLSVLELLAVSSVLYLNTVRCQNYSADSLVFNLHSKTFFFSLSLFFFFFPLGIYIVICKYLCNVKQVEISPSVLVIFQHN